MTAQCWSTTAKKRRRLGHTNLSYYCAESWCRATIFVRHPEQGTRGNARHDREETERGLVYRRDRAKLAGTEIAFAMVLTARFLSMVHGVPRQRHW
jgi:hypothetical protein